MTGRDHSEDVDVDGRIILERIRRNRVGRCVYWMHLVQNRDQ